MPLKKCTDNLLDNSNTVLSTAKGTIDASEIKGILIHEHVFNKFPFRLRDTAESFAVAELANAYANGINVIVDLTPYTNPYDYYRVIDESPVNIATCVGFYTTGYMSPKIRRMTEDELVRSLSKKIENGVGTRKMKPVILKIAVQKDCINDTEQKFMRAVGRLSTMYNLPVALHAPFSTYGHSIHLMECGVAPSKLMIAHIENGISKEEELLARTKHAIDLAALGCYIQLSDFGSGPTTQKCKKALSLFDELINAGFINSILISSDSNWRWKNAKPVLRNSSQYSAGRRFTYALSHTMPLLNIRTEKAARDIFLYRNPLKFLDLLT